MPETIVNPTPDDLPESAYGETGGIRAAIRDGRRRQAGDAADGREAMLARVRERRSAAQNGDGRDEGELRRTPEARQASRDRTEEALANAQAAIENARDAREAIISRQSGAAPRRAIGAEAGSVQAAVAEVHRALADMRGENELHERDRRRGRADPVRAERIARTDDAIDAADRRVETLHRQNQTREVLNTMARALDSQARQISAMRRGRFDEPETDAQGRRITPQARQSRLAFEAYMRRGDENALRSNPQAMTTADDTGGGYFIPVEWDRTLTRLLTALSVMRQISTVQPISGPILKMPKNLNGATAGWIGETTAPTVTATPTLSELTFTVMELYAEPQATQQLLEDANIDLEQWLAGEVQFAMAQTENPAFMTGTGANQPRGLMSYTMVADASWSWGKFGYFVTGVSGDWASSTPPSGPADSLLDLIYGLHPSVHPTASWLINRLLVKEIRKFKDTTGEYIWQPSVQAGQPAMLMDFPVYMDDYMPVKAANSFSVGFGDWASTYLILDRSGASVLRDPYTAKPYVNFYTRKRVGGGVKEFQRAKFLKFGTS